MSLVPSLNRSVAMAVRYIGSLIKRPLEEVDGAAAAQS